VADVPSGLSLPHPKKVILQNPVALVNDLIGVGGHKGATACRVRRLVVCYVDSLL
jgi:hypothetical protein